jgi:hypothetical protein
MANPLTDLIKTAIFIQLIFQQRKEVRMPKGESPSDRERRITEWSSMEIPTHLINKFLELWTITFKSKRSKHVPLPENPLEKLREMLKGAVLVGDDVYKYKCWFLIFEDNALHDLILTPGITYHARIRLRERLQYFGANMYFLVATEIWAGQPLSREETKRYWKTADQEKIKAVKFENHLYFLTEQFDIVTVIDLNQ